MSQKCYAFLIGANGPQTAHLRSLKYAERDAERLAEALKGPICSFTEAEWIVAAKRETTLTQLKAFTDKCELSDLLIVYFSGHGLLDEQLFLICNGTDITNMDASALGIDAIKRILRRCKARYKLLILDCCYAGGAFSGALRGDQAIESILSKEFEGSASIILSACSRFEQARELESLDGGAGFLSWVLTSACTTRFSEVSPDHFSLSLMDIWRWLPIAHTEVSNLYSGNGQLPRPILISQLETGTDGEIWLTKESRDITKHRDHDKPRHDREVFLQALMTDHSSFMRDRLGSFVGREKELIEIRQRIAEKQQTGGYVTITGQAGQGKSSIIAKLVQEYGSENVAFHFIPFNPGPDHQVGLLRNVMARLTLKYNLSDLYVASESRPALRDYFPRVLQDLFLQNKKEVIFIDGLDQLEEDFNGSRDLSFLPTNPPPGIVFVLGTRPNDTLRPLELLKPHHEYVLPNLSRDDFDLILQHRKVLLERNLVDLFYKAMQENALYLDLVAKELVERGDIPATEIIRQIADNPENLFSFSMTRLKRQPVEWREVIKPVLGALLVSREPLARKHLRQIINVDEDRLNDGLEKLGGLISDDGQQRYYLFHLKLQEFLRQDEQNAAKKYIFANDEEERWHNNLAAWCEQDQISHIWHDMKYHDAEQKRREYARKHYISHLYYAREWGKLFFILDKGEYGRAKLMYDPSTRSYVQDLDFGRQAAAARQWDMHDAILLLPKLWQYTLLRCSLTSRADSYPLESFGILIDLKREKEALDLAELLTDQSHKVTVLLLIAERMHVQPTLKQTSMQVFFRADEVAYAIRNKEQRINALKQVGQTFARMELWDEAERAIKTIDNVEQKAVALVDLSVTQAKARLWTKAIINANEGIALIQSLDNAMLRDNHYKSLCPLFIQAQWWEQAIKVARAIEQSHERLLIFQELIHALINASQWELAENAINLLELDSKQVLFNFHEERALLLTELARALTQTRMFYDAAKRISEKALEIAYSLIDSDEKIYSSVNIKRMTNSLVDDDKVAYSLIDSDVKALILGRIAGIWEELAKLPEYTQMLHRAKILWEEALSIVNSISASGPRANILEKMSSILAEAQHWEEAISAAISIPQVTQRANALDKLSKILAQAQHWELAEHVAYFIFDLEHVASVLSSVCCELTQAQLWKQARRLALSIVTTVQREETLEQLIKRLLEAQEWEQAQEILLHIRGNERFSRAAQAICKKLGQEKKWQQAELVARMITAKDDRDCTLTALSSDLIAAGEWNSAQKLVRTLEISEWLITALCQLGSASAHIHHYQQTKEIWNEAHDLIWKLEDPIKRVQALCELGRVLRQTQQQAIQVWDEAMSVAYSIHLSGLRWEALSILSKNLAQARLSDKVLTVTDAIGGSQLRDQTLFESSIILMKSGQFTDAETAMRAIRNEGMKSSALKQLGLLLAQTGEWNRATALWEEARSDASLTENEWRTLAFRGISKALAIAECWDQAVEVANSIMAPAARVKILQELALASTASGYTDHATQMWEEAINTSHAIDTIYERAVIQRELGKALTQAGHLELASIIWPEAINTTNSIAENKQRELALRELNQLLIEQQQWTHAIDVVHHLDNKADKQYLLLELSLILIERQQWTHAMNIIPMIERISSRLQASVSLGNALEREQQWAMAIQVWDDFIIVARGQAVGEKYADALEQVGALRALRRALEQTQQWQRAQTICEEVINTVRTIDDTSMRWVHLSQLARELAQTQQWEQALTVTQEIAEETLRVKTFHEIEKAITASQQWAQTTQIWEATLAADPAPNLQQQLDLLSASKRDQDKRDITDASLLENASTKQLSRSIARDKWQIEKLVELSKAMIESLMWEKAVPLWEELLILVLVLSDLETRTQTLAMLNGIISSIQQRECIQVLWEKVLAWTSSLAGPVERIEALVALSRGPHQKDLWEQILPLLNEVIAEVQTLNEENKQVDIATLCALLAEAQQWKMAEKIAHSTNHSNRSFDGLLRLSNMLARIQQWDRAEVVARSIHEIEKNSEALYNLCRALTQAKLWQKASTLAASISLSTQRSIALGMIGSALMQNDAWEQAEAMWKGAFVVANALQNKKQKAYVLGELGVFLAQAHLWEQAIDTWHELLKLAGKIKDDTQKIYMRKELNAISEPLPVERPITAVNSIALGKEEDILTAAHQWKHAQQSWVQTKALLTASHRQRQQLEKHSQQLDQLLQQQAWSQAEALLQAATDSAWQSSGARRLSNALADKHLWEQALQVAKGIGDHQQRCEALQILITDLSQEKQWSMALDVWEAAWQETYAEPASFKRRHLLTTLEKRLAQMQEWQSSSLRQKLFSAKERIMLSIQQARQQEIALTSSLENWWEQYRMFRVSAHALTEAHQQTAAEAIWEPIIAEVHAMPIDARRMKALKLIGMALSQAHLWNLALPIWEEIASSVLKRNDSQEKVEVLLALNEALVQTRQWERAETLARSIVEIEYSSRALVQLGLALAQAQHWDKAESVIRSITEIETSSSALYQLIKLLIQAGLWERAEALLPIIALDGWRIKVLRSSSKTYAQAQKWRQAEALARSIGDNTWRIITLAELGQEFSQFQQYDSAQALWNEAITSADVIKDLPQRAALLRVLGAIFAQSQQWKRSMILWNESTKSIPALFTLQEEFVEISKAALPASSPVLDEELHACLDSLQCWNTSIKVALFKALIQHHLWEQARKVALTLNKPQTELDLLKMMGHMLLKEQQWEKAESLWQEIMLQMRSGEEEKAEAQAELSWAQAGARKWKQAFITINSIKSKSWQIYALRRLSRTLTDIVAWKEVEELLPLLQPTERQFIVMIELGKAFTQMQWQDDAQYIWQRATTLAYEMIKNRAAERKADQEETPALQPPSLEPAARSTQVERNACLTLSEVEQQIAEFDKLEQALWQTQQWEYLDQARHIISDLQCYKQLCSIRESISEGPQKLVMSRLFSPATVGLSSIAAERWRETITLEARKSRVEIRSKIPGDRTRKNDQQELEHQPAQIVSEQEHNHTETELYHIISTTPSKERKIQAQVELCALLIRAEQWDMAESIARSISSTQEKVNALRLLGSALARAQLQDQAWQAWNSALDIIHAFEGLSSSFPSDEDLAISVAKEDWSQPSAIQRRLEAASPRIWKDLSDFSDYNNAHQIFFTTIPDIQAKIAELKAIINKSSGSEKLIKYFNRIWNDILVGIYYMKDKNFKIQLLQEIAVLFEEGILVTFADQFWRDATSLVNDMWRFQEHVELMQEWGEYLIEHRKWHLIEPIMIMLSRNIFYNLYGDSQYDAPQYKSSPILVNFSEKIMIELLSRLPSTVAPNILLVCINAELYQIVYKPHHLFRTIGQITRLLRVAQKEDTITNLMSLLATEIMSVLNERDHLSSGRKQSARTEAWVEARNAPVQSNYKMLLKIFASYEDSWKQFMQEFISFLLHEEQGELAWKLIDSPDQGFIIDAFNKANILINLIVTPQSGIQETALEQFINCVTEIASSEAREIILEQLQMTLKKIKDPEELYRFLHIIHRFWLQAKTKQDALTLLTLGNVFILSQPSIGIAFCEAFTWADTFLQG